MKEHNSNEIRFETIINWQLNTTQIADKSNKILFVFLKMAKALK